METVEYSKEISLQNCVSVLHEEVHLNRMEMVLLSRIFYL